MEIISPVFLWNRFSVCAYGQTVSISLCRNAKKKHQKEIEIGANRENVHIATKQTKMKIKTTAFHSIFHYNCDLCAKVHWLSVFPWILFIEFFERHARARIYFGTVRPSTMLITLCLSRSPVTGHLFNSLECFWFRFSPKWWRKQNKSGFSDVQTGLFPFRRRVK